MYLAVCTRPDIAQAVGALAKYMTAATTIHWSAALGSFFYHQGLRHLLQQGQQNQAASGLLRLGLCWRP